MCGCVVVCDCVGGKGVTQVYSFHLTPLHLDEKGKKSTTNVAHFNSPLMFYTSINQPELIECVLLFFLIYPATWTAHCRH